MTRNDSRKRLAADGGAELDDLFRVAREEIRRVTLYLLLERERVPVEELADAVAGWVRARRGAVATRAYRDEVGLELSHRHLPHMADANLVEYDREAGTASLADRSESVLSFVERAYEGEYGTGRPE